MTEANQGLLVFRDAKDTRTVSDQAQITFFQIKDCILSLDKLPNLSSLSEVHCVHAQVFLLTQI